MDLGMEPSFLAWITFLLWWSAVRNAVFHNVVSSSIKWRQLRWKKNLFYAKRNLKGQYWYSIELSRGMDGSNVTVTVTVLWSIVGKILLWYVENHSLQYIMNPVFYSMFQHQFSRIFRLQLFHFPFVDNRNDSYF